MTKETETIIKERVAGRPRLLIPGVMAFAYCPGCHHPTTARVITEVLEEMGMGDRTVGVFGIGCSTFLMGWLDFDTIGGAHGRPPDLATGAKRAHPENIVFTLQGDGDLLSIGADPLLGALSRGEKITIIMQNNAVYGTTGGQMAPTTLPGQVTTTSPEGRDVATAGFPAHAAEMIATFKGAAYSARGAFTSPKDYNLTKKYIRTAFQKQMDKIGLSIFNERRNAYILGTRSEGNSSCVKLSTDPPPEER